MNSPVLADQGGEGGGLQECGQCLEEVSLSHNLTSPHLRSDSDQPICGFTDTGFAGRLTDTLVQNILKPILRLGT